MKRVIIEVENVAINVTFEQEPLDNTLLNIQFSREGNESAYSFDELIGFKRPIISLKTIIGSIFKEATRLTNVNEDLKFSFTTDCPKRLKLYTRFASKYGFALTTIGEEDFLLKRG